VRTSTKEAPCLETTSAALLSLYVSRDVPDLLVEWRNAGIKTYIYSSGSREAQRLFFEYSQAGDLRPFLCGFFDTSSGLKTEAASYTNIQHTLGVDDADQVGWGGWQGPEGEGARWFVEFKTHTLS
jgi:hypothetical protein